MRLASHALAAPDIDLRVAQIERPSPLDPEADVLEVRLVPIAARLVIA